MSVSVADVMSERVVAVREGTAFAEVVAAMRRFRRPSLPVIDDRDRVVGVVSEDDVLLKEAIPDRAASYAEHRRLRRDRRRTRAVTAGELMTSPAVTVLATTSAREAARLMYRHRIHQLPVVEAGSRRLQGIVTRSDLLAVFDRTDEDVHRDILALINGHPGLDPALFSVVVETGAVRIRGDSELRSTILTLIEAIERVEGVTEVSHYLTYERDDTAAARRAYQ